LHRYPGLLGQGTKLRGNAPVDAVREVQFFNPLSFLKRFSDRVASGDDGAGIGALLSHEKPERMYTWE
jgi:hypothetical protein